MEYLRGLLYSLTTNEQTVKMAVLAIALLAGLMMAMALFYLISGTYSPIRQQIQRLRASSDGIDMSSSYQNYLEATLNKVGNHRFFAKTIHKDKDNRKLLIHAGFHSENALKVYYAIRLLALLFGIGLASLVHKLFPDQSAMVSVYLIILIVGGCFILPGIVLARLAEKRMRKLRKHFPDALDLLVVCCESGLGLLESFQRVSRELKAVHSELSHELGLVVKKVKVGIPLSKALEEFGHRTGLDDIRGLNSVIVQSIKLGTGVAETVRVYADEYRDKRLQAAEEMAAKIAVKMIFPMMVCIWPSFFIVAIGPAILKVMEVWDTAF
ncbi:type II secretion system F family protein [Alteromonas sp. ASW11-19]|uniref:Type II secretion system F family protein n=1 Tax=Alteromonas salexigens TaxID=2982530 RepID=A0ABT2VPS6_9ALTE|nr:type II secretion system F family protein [Alteromonas salexigens]MCU7554867.1 type II secretion system F family protein [Alteromonas salexigens]